MHFDLYDFYLPLALMVVPWALARWVFVTASTHKLRYWPSGVWLIAAGVMWDVAIYAPIIPGSPSDSLVTHLLGGTIAGLLFIYIARAYKIRFAHWWQLALPFFGLSSALAVLNENAELLLGGSGSVDIDLMDVQWDLAASTIGTLAVIPLLLVWWRYRQQ